MEKEIKYYIKLKNGNKKYYDWNYEGLRKIQYFVYENQDKVQINENGFYTIYKEEV